MSRWIIGNEFLDKYLNPKRGPEIIKNLVRIFVLWTLGAVVLAVTIAAVQFGYQFLNEYGQHVMRAIYILVVPLFVGLIFFLKEKSDDEGQK